MYEVMSTHSASGCSPRIPFLLLISICSSPSSLGRDRRRGRGRLYWLLSLRHTRMLATWRASSRAGSPEHTKTIVICCAVRGQEVAKCRR